MSGTASAGAAPAARPSACASASSCRHCPGPGTGSWHSCWLQGRTEAARQKQAGQQAAATAASGRAAAAAGQCDGTARPHGQPGRAPRPRLLSTDWNLQQGAGDSGPRSAAQRPGPGRHQEPLAAVRVLECAQAAQGPGPEAPDADAGLTSSTATFCCVQPLIEQCQPIRARSVGVRPSARGPVQCLAQSQPCSVLNEVLMNQRLAVPIQEASQPIRPMLALRCGGRPARRRSFLFAADSHAGKRYDNLYNSRHREQLQDSGIGMCAESAACRALPCRVPARRRPYRRRATTGEVHEGRSRVGHAARPRPCTGRHTASAARRQARDTPARHRRQCGCTPAERVTTASMFPCGSLVATCTGWQEGQAVRCAHTRLARE